MNKLKTTLLLGGLTGLVIAVGYYVSFLNPSADGGAGEKIGDNEVI